MCLVITIILFIIIGILGFIANSLRKRRMSKALGRNVSNYDATSINSWIEVAEKEEKKQ